MKKEPQQIQEILPVLVGGAILIPLAVHLASLFAAFQYYVKKTKEDKKLSKKLKSILKDGKDWKVMVITDKIPNAFAMHKPYVFLSSGLIDMLDEKELVAVMLHEAGHIRNHDVWKDIISKHGIIALMFGVVGTFTGAAGLWALLFIWFMFDTPEFVLQTVLMRTMGRAAENKADSFAVKYGYGDELVSSLNKIEIFAKRYMKKHCTTFMCKARNKIEEIIGEHPPLETRVGNILKSKETWESKNKSFVQYRNFFQNKLGVKKEG